MVREHLQENIYYFNEGNHYSAYQFLGSKYSCEQGVEGFRFSVWAPNAYAVYLQGDFNCWTNQAMERLEGGVWSLFVNEACEGHCYKYGIDHGNGHIEYKMDPFGFRFEIAPKDATIVHEMGEYEWRDQTWLRSRAKKNLYEMPIQIYEVHATSWKQHMDGVPYSFDELADELIPTKMSGNPIHQDTDSRLMCSVDQTLETIEITISTTNCVVSGNLITP